MKLWGVKRKRNPYTASSLGSATFSIGTEAGDQIAVAVQLKYGNGGDLAARGHVKAYLSSDTHGDVLASSPEGVAIGTDGLLLARGDAGTNELVRKATLAIDVVPEKFKTTAIAAYRIAGVVYTKAATTAIVFSAAHVVSASKFGVILIQINAAGTVSTKVPSATQAYNSAPLALAALPSPDAGNVALGYIAIAAKAATWTANTDDMTNGSDLTTAAFVDADEATTVPRIFDLVSEADGDIDVVITDTRAPRTYYLNLVMPDGSLYTSGAITFA